MADLLSGLDLTGNLDDVEQNPRPTCNPCKNGECWKCPRVLARRGIISSDFPCACFHRDPDEHDAARDNYEEERDGHFGRLNWDSEGRTAYTSVEHLF